LAIRYAELNSHLLQLTCLPDSVIAEVRRDPRTIVGAFASCRAELKAVLPATFGPERDMDRYRGRVIAALRHGWFQYSLTIYDQATTEGFRQMIRDSYRERRGQGASN
jgi:hypothetical protein